MNIASIIGSLLLFEKKGLDNDKLSRIYIYSKDNMVINFKYNDIYDLKNALYSFSDCFEIINDKIVETNYYRSNQELLKQRFFDCLSPKEKKIIYNIVSIL